MGKQEKQWHLMKLQRPLYSTEEEAPILAYNEDRSLQYNVHLSDSFIDQLFGSSFKVYASCSQVDNLLEIDMDTVVHHDLGW